MSDPLASTLTGIVGPTHVLLDSDLKAAYETDWTRRYHGAARLVVRPGSTAELSAVLSACSQAGAAIVPQGGNTGLVGGGVPRGGEVVVSTTRLDTIDPVDTASAEVTAGAGVTLARLQAHAREAGLGFGVDLASRDSATIGGMIATNAGGIRVLRYGPMRHQVVGLEAVRADGTIVRRLPGLSKDNTGYDLPGLLAGSEGTLAIITCARLRLIPQLQARATALLAFGSISSALTMLDRIRALPGLEAVEVFFREGVELVCRHTGLPLPFREDYSTYVLIECASQSDPTPSLVAGLEGGPFLESAITRDRRQRDTLWSYRERHTESINAEGVPQKLDIAVPLARLADFAASVRARLAAAAPEARAILFGHIADGNIHVNLLGLGLQDDRGADAVLRLVAELGGSISAEHGIGVAKTRWLTLTRTSEDIATMRAIKHALDPEDLLNPGVLFA